MRPASALALGCLGALALAAGALMALVWIGGVSPPIAVPVPGASPTPEPSPTPLPETFVSHVGRLGEFRREDSPESYRLSYAFVDHHGRSHRVTCSVDRAAHEAERRSYGYEEEAFKAAYNRRLATLLAREIEARGLTPYFTIKFHGWGGYQSHWAIPPDAAEDEKERARTEIERMARWLDRGFERKRDDIQRQLFKEHGLLLRNRNLSIDYSGLAERGSGTAAACFEALRAAGRGSTLRQYLGLFVAFFQELTYEIPPKVEDGRQILGLWVPSDVLVRGRGDCDSKSAAFAAMWRRMPTALLFIILPRHVLVAVEAPPWPGERFVRLGNRHFLFSEVAGPGKSRPGFKAPEGNYEYVLFEPASP